MLLSVSRLFTMLVACFSLVPFAWMVLTAIRPESDHLSATVSYVPSQVTAVNFVEVLQRTQLPQMFLNSIVATLGTVAVTLTVAILGGYALSRFQFRGRTGILLMFFAPQMLPVVLLLVPLFVILRTVGLINTTGGLVVVYSAFLLPLAVWLAKGAFDAVPIEVEEAARIDGCTRIGALSRVVLPIAIPGVAATATYVGIAAWNELLFATMFTSGLDARTWPVGVQLFIGEFQLRWGALSAAGVLTTVPVVLGFLLLQRSLVHGVASGAVKG